MGLICEYFATSSDEEAASVIDRLGGPRILRSAAVGATQPPRRELFRRKVESARAPSAALETEYRSVSGNGIEPVVQMGTLEALLIGRSYDEVMESHPGGQMVAMRDGGERLVVRLSDTLANALAGATDQELAQVAVPWSQTDEFWGQGSPDVLAGFLGELAELARHARGNSEHLYCWLCV